MSRHGGLDRVGLPRERVDMTLLAAVAAISSLGTVMVYSATKAKLALEGQNPHALFQRQVVWVFLGILVMFAVTFVDYRVLRDFSALAYVGIVGVLLLVITPFGSSSKGAQAWFDLGTFRFQPSELAKVVLIVVLASYCHEHRGDMDAWRLAVALGLAGVPLGLILLQPDLGTGLVLAVILFAVLLVAGTRGRHLAVLALCAVTAFAALWWTGALAEHQVDRLTSFLDQAGKDQSEDAKAAVFNLRQSKIAIGAGGVVGKGWGKGTQTSLAWVPEQHTDFIFTAVGEELGFLGAATLLALFAVVVWRTWVTAQIAKDLFGMLVCIGVLAMFAFQIFENIGMTMGIMPITGIPLPFMSYGGSSALASFASVGLVLNVAMRRYT